MLIVSIGYSWNDRYLYTTPVPATLWFFPVSSPLRTVETLDKKYLYNLSWHSKTELCLNRLNNIFDFDFDCDYCDIIFLCPLYTNQRPANSEASSGWIDSSYYPASRNSRTNGFLQIRHLIWYERARTVLWASTGLLCQLLRINTTLESFFTCSSISTFFS